MLNLLTYGELVLILVHKFVLLSIKIQIQLLKTICMNKYIASVYLHVNST